MNLVYAATWSVRHSSFSLFVPVVLILVRKYGGIRLSFTSALIDDFI